MFSLQKHSNAKQELEQMLLVVEETDKPEIEDNVAFYDANLSGLTQELEQLKRKYQPVSNLSLPTRGVSLKEIPPLVTSSGSHYSARYASHWDAFLL